MRPFIGIVITAFVLIATTSAVAQTRTLLYGGVGVAGILDDSQYGDGSFEMRRFSLSWGKLSIGYGAVAEIGSTDQYVGGLLTLDCPFNRNVGISLSTGPGYYTNVTLDLGSHFELRSGFELYLQEKEWRISLGIFHYSNAGVGDTNPGSEAVRLAVAIPLPF